MDIVSSFSNYPAYKLRFQAWESEINIENNTSKVTVVATAYRTGPSGYRYSLDRLSACHLTLGSHNESKTIGYDFRAVEAIEVFRHSLVIEHEADGSKSITVGTTLDWDQLGRVSVVQTFTLTTIPRATKIRSVSGQIGGVLTAEYTPASPTFTHQFWWQDHTGAWQEVQANSNGAAFHVALNHAQSAPNSTAIPVRVSLRTLSNGRHIGEDHYYTYHSPVPAVLAPKVGAVTVAEANSAIPALGANTFAQGVSKVKVSVKNATSEYGAKIATVYMQLLHQGKEIATYSQNAAALEYAFENVAVHGQVRVGVAVWDTRGMQTSYFHDINLLPYQPPRIEYFIAKRSGGDTSKVIQATYATRYSNLNGKNRLNVLIEHSERGKNTWSKGFERIAHAVNTQVTDASIGVAFDVAKSYDVRMTITDALGSKAHAMATVGTSIATASWGKRGMSVGGVMLDDNFQGLEVHGGIKNVSDGSLYQTAQQLAHNAPVVYPVTVMNGTQMLQTTTANAESHYNSLLVKNGIASLSIYVRLNNPAVGTTIAAIPAKYAPAQAAIPFNSTNWKVFWLYKDGTIRINTANTTGEVWAYVSYPIK